MNGRSIRAKALQALVAACSIGTLAGCSPRGPSSPHAVLGPDAEPLRAAFNRDTDKVRVVMLVAPT